MYRANEEGIALISVVLMVMFLSMMIGGIAKYYIGAEAKGVEDSLLRIRHYWASVAGWERYRAAVASASTTITWDMTDLNAPANDNLWNDPDGLDDLVMDSDSSPTTLVSYNPGTAVEATFAIDLTEEIKTGTPEKTVETINTDKLDGADPSICKDTDDHYAGKTIITPRLILGSLFADYETDYLNKVYNNNGDDNHQRLQVRFCAVGVLESGITDLIVTGWRYASDEVF